MTSRPAGAAASVLAALLLAAGCTSADDDATGGTAGGTTGDAAATAPSAGTPVPSAPALPPAGSAEAEALAPLPDGAATGTAVVAYSGVGEVRSPFTGECSSDGDATVLEGTADTAAIRLEVAPDGVRLDLDDVGFSASSDLAEGRYEVTGGHLSLDAPLVSGGQPVGQVQLEVDCGG